MKQKTKRMCHAFATCCATSVSPSLSVTDDMTGTSNRHPWCSAGAPYSLYWESFQCRVVSRRCGTHSLQPLQRLLLQRN